MGAHHVVDVASVWQPPVDPVFTWSTSTTHAKMTQTDSWWVWGG